MNKVETTRLYFDLAFLVCALFRCHLLYLFIYLGGMSLIVKASTIRVERVICLISNIDGLLLNGLRPGERKLAIKVHVPIQDISQSVSTLSAREPCRNKCIPLVNVVRNDERPPREHNDNKRYPGGFHLFEHLLVNLPESNGGTVMRSLCTRLLRNNCDDHVVAFRTVSFLS